MFGRSMNLGAIVALQALSHAAQEVFVVAPSREVRPMRNVTPSKRMPLSYGRTSPKFKSHRVWVGGGYRVPAWFKGSKTAKRMTKRGGNQAAWQKGA